MIGRSGRALTHALHYLSVDASEWIFSKLLYSPILRARCGRAGERLSVASLPRIRGEANISIGSGCTFSTFDVEAHGIGTVPEISFGNDCFLANDTMITVSERISIGNNVGIGPWVDIRDMDGYPSDTDARDVAPVTIEDHAWIGRGAHITKGVRIGKRAIVAAGSVVMIDVPDGALAMGAPARIIRVR